MSAGLKRREIITGGLIGAAALAVPVRALADPLGDAFDQAMAPPATPAPSQPLTVPAVPEPNPAYERRVLEIAQREDRSGHAVVDRLARR